MDVPNTTPCAVIEAAKPATRRPDARIGGGLPCGPFHLGMPHLTSAGLCAEWPLRRCCRGLDPHIDPRPECPLAQRGPPSPWARLTPG